MIIENIILVIGLIGLGTLCRKKEVLPENAAEVLNKFILNISLPAIIVISISKLTINSDMIAPIVIHWGSFILHIGLIYLASKIFGFSKSVFGALLIVTSLGNTAFLGIPMVNTFIGADAVPYAVLYDQLGSGIGFIIFGAFVLPGFVGKEAGNKKEVLLGLLKFPPFVALILGFVFIYVPLPSVIENFLSNLAATLIPCAMIAVGFQMKYRLPKSTLLPMGVGLWLKLFLIPLIVYFFVNLYGESSISIKTSIFQSGMPPMITAGAMVINEKMEEDLCASLVGYGLIFSFITLTLLNLIV